MAITNYGRAKKGSRRHIQDYVNDKVDLLNALILGASTSLMAFGTYELNWKSPLRNDPSGKDYLEYRDGYLEPLGLADRKDKLTKFWPKNGPQWDALAVAKGREGDGYILVEAKAHPEELYSAIKASSPASLDLIDNSIARTKRFMQANGADWTKKHYQLANRLSHLFFLCHIVCVPAWLVLINFTDDEAHKPTDIKKWLATYTETFREMRISHNSPLLDRVITVFPAVT